MLGWMRMYEMEDIGLVTCNRRVMMFLAPIPKFDGAKFVSLKVFGVETENVVVQFMYGCSLIDVTLANITIDMDMGLVDAGFLALLKVTVPAAEVSVLNRPGNLTISDTLALVLGKLKVHNPLHILETLVVIKLL